MWKQNVNNSKTCNGKPSEGTSASIKHVMCKRDSLNVSALINYKNKTHYICLFLARFHSTFFSSYSSSSSSLFRSLRHKENVLCNESCGGNFPIFHSDSISQSSRVTMPLDILLKMWSALKPMLLMLCAWMLCVLVCSCSFIVDEIVLGTRAYRKQETPSKHKRQQTKEMRCIILNGVVTGNMRCFFFFHRWCSCIFKILMIWTHTCSFSGSQCIQR